MIVKTLSSLEKCFWDDDLSLKKEVTSLSMFKNEKQAFEIAYCENDDFNGDKNTVYFRIESDIPDKIHIFRIMNVPVSMPTTVGSDDNFLRKTPGLYPDLLIPWGENLPLYSIKNFVSSLWIEIDKPDLESDHELNCVFFRGNDILCEKKFVIHVINAELPKQDFIYTQWFYTDCLMDYYKTKAYDKKHWEIIFNYMKNASEHGINMILTPVFTPALDTAVGHERTNVQLVDIEINDGKYSFNFDKLGKWIKYAHKAGIKYFEISHFFTQWGAKATPKIMAKVDGTEKRIFGWDVPSDSEKYADFLKVFIPELLAYLKSKKVDKYCRFHISDEPRARSIEDYMKAHDVVRSLLDGYQIMDALSEYDFYEKGIVDIPVPSTRAVHTFIDNKVKGLWTYYCCTATNKLSNRFMAMPSSRNRIIGAQLYKYNIKGYLHWGFNFWNCQLSYYNVNPFLSPDGDIFAGAGDQTSVYPAPDGTPYPSIREKVFYDALQDMRAYKLCEKYYGKRFVLKILEKDGRKIHFSVSDYPTEYIRECREEINAAIEKAICENNK